MTNRQDWLLMHRVAAGEEEAVAELYDRFSSLLYKVARQLLPTQADAEDAIQEIFVRLWKTADRYDPHRAKLVTWVMLIGRRHMIDRLRRTAARPKHSILDTETEGTNEDHTPERTPLEEERNTKLMQRIAQLPELQRTVIKRAYLHGFTLREVSDQLDAPLGTIKSALSRGLARLREQNQSDCAM